jgi:hypothetical protein
MILKFCLNFELTFLREGYPRWACEFSAWSVSVSVCNFSTRWPTFNKFRIKVRPPDIAKRSVIHTVSRIKTVNIRTYEVEAILVPLDLMFIKLCAVRGHSMPMPVAARSKE